MVTETVKVAPSIQSLYAGLSGRPWPETVVEAILAVFGRDLNGKERAVLEKVKRPYWRSYLPTKFDPTASLERPASLLALLIGLPPLPPSAGRDVDEIRSLLKEARAYLGMKEGQVSYKNDRRNRKDRAEMGLDISRRRYDKLFRLTGRLEAYVTELEDQDLLFGLGRFAKTAFASELTREDFGSAPASAAFVAYYTANLGRRSVFTAGKQARALDEVAELLFRWCERSKNTNWFALAHVYPRPEVLGRLTVEQRVSLLDRALTILRQSGEGLELLASRGDLDLESMIVRKGNDSSTWNSLAGAWNRARDYWIALVYSLGEQEIFDGFLPGKALRLMAADVAAWHRSLGEKPPIDTSIWATLPKPWDVVTGREKCGRSDVLAVCSRFGVDADKTGWSAPRPLSTVDLWRPTPDTVHGVVVGHPELALFLRKVGAFSGKSLRWPNEG
jgi:hypothetical protein